MKRVTQDIKWAVVFCLMSACVESVEFNVPNPELLTIIEGRITDQKGAYSINISKGLSLDSDSSVSSRVSGALVTLFDNSGNNEQFIEVAPGRYQTKGAIQGEIGHSYFVRVLMPDGAIFESEIDTLTEGGEILAITHEFEARQVEQSWGTTDASVFNIYIDASTGNSSNNYVRWKYTGVYKVETYPELNMTWNPPYSPYKTPRPCSGYVVVPGPEGSGGLLQKIGECTCCTCWINNFETIPQVSDNQFVSDGLFKRIKVGEVPLLREAFEDKFMVVVEQSGMTRKVFDFFNLIRNQKINASNIFQPPSGELIGNFRAINSDNKVVGIFWASSISQKTLFLSKKDLPYPLPPFPFDGKLDACYALFPNATTQRPLLWE